MSLKYCPSLQIYIYAPYIYFVIIHKIIQHITAVLSSSSAAELCNDTVMEGDSSALSCPLCRTTELLSSIYSRMSLQ